jgi:hypothetical protein
MGLRRGERFRPSLDSASPAHAVDDRAKGHMSRTLISRFC